MDPHTPVTVRWTRTETTTFEATAPLGQLVSPLNMKDALAALDAGTSLQAVLELYGEVVEHETPRAEVMFDVGDRTVVSADPPARCGDCGDPLPDATPGTCGDCRDQRRLAAELAVAEARA